MEETFAPGSSVSIVARRHDVNTNLLVQLASALPRRHTRPEQAGIKSEGIGRPGPDPGRRYRFRFRVTAAAACGGLLRSAADA